MRLFLNLSNAKDPFNAGLVVPADGTPEAET
jgi:hypothetical protein